MSGLEPCTFQHCLFLIHSLYGVELQYAPSLGLCINTQSVSTLEEIIQFCCTFESGKKLIDWNMIARVVHSPRL